MYKEMTAEDHLRVLGLAPEDVPDLLLLLGIFDVHTGGERLPVTWKGRSRCGAIPVISRDTAT